MEPVFVFQFPVIPCAYSEVWPVEHWRLSHLLKELHHAFPRKVPRMQHTGLVEQLLLHVQVVAPVARLEEGSMVIEARLDETSERPQYNEEEDDGPAHSLETQGQRQTCHKYTVDHENNIRDPTLFLKLF